MKTDQELLKEILSYDPNTGCFTWIKQKGRAKVGEVAGYMNDSGYISIQFKGKSERAHRLAHLYMVGRLPRISIDHLNGNRSDNRWFNIPEVGQSLNTRNSKIKSGNKTGITGVFWTKKDGRWRSIVSDNDGKVIYKCSKTLLDAAAWRKSKEIQFKYSENSGRKTRHVEDMQEPKP